MKTYKLLLVCVFCVVCGCVGHVQADTKVTSVKNVDQTLAQGVSKSQKWEKGHQARLNRSSKIPKVDIMFFGDSITAGWSKQVLEEHYGQYVMVNMGVGGDRIEHMAWRLEHGIGKVAQPKVIVVLGGTNNSNDNTPQQIAGGIFSLTDQLNKVFPKSQIVLIGPLPRLPHPRDAKGEQAAPNTVKAACGVLAGYHYPSYVHYLDLSAYYLKPDGSVNNELFRDHVHLNTDGYTIWATQMKETLLPLLK